MRPVAWKIAKPARSALAQKPPVQTLKYVAPLKRQRKSILVDGNNVLYQFYNPLSGLDRDGQQTAAIQGMFSLLKRLDAMHKPQHICVFFDRPKQTTARKMIDPTYKSNRRPTPSALRSQLQSVSTMLEAAKVNCIPCIGIEADDLIASYTKTLHSDDYDVLIVSNDNDFLQLTRGEPASKANPVAAPVTEEGETKEAHEPQPSTACVEIYQMNKRRYLRERHIRSRFSVAPWQLPDFFSLCGIGWGKLPRVEGMTDEVAVELLTKYGSVHGLLRNLNELEDAQLRKTLKQTISHVETSYRIAKLVSEYALPLVVDELVSPDLEQLPELGIAAKP